MGLNTLNGRASNFDTMLGDYRNGLISGAIFGSIMGGVAPKLATFAGNHPIKNALIRGTVAGIWGAAAFPALKTVIEIQPRSEKMTLEGKEYTPVVSHRYQL